MVHIDALAHVSQENRLGMKTELTTEVKEEIRDLEGRMVSWIEALKSSVDYIGRNNFIFHHDTDVASITVLEDTVVTRPPPSTNFFTNTLS